MPTGRFKATPIPGTLQFGTSPGGHEQIGIDLKLENGVTCTAFLIFSEGAKPYSMERLQKLGWPGEGHPLNESDLTKEVEVDISYRQYNGEEKLDVSIVTDGGRVKMQSTMDDAQKQGFLTRLTGVAPNAAKLDF